MRSVCYSSSSFFYHSCSNTHLKRSSPRYLLLVGLTLLLYPSSCFCCITKLRKIPFFGFKKKTKLIWLPRRFWKICLPLPPAFHELASVLFLLYYSHYYPKLKNCYNRCLPIRTRGCNNLDGGSVKLSVNVWISISVCTLRNSALLFDSLWTRLLFDL